MKDLLLGVVLWVILPLALAEAVLVGPWLAERLLRWGARGLPEAYQERYVEDWLGELDAVPGSLWKVAFAVQVLVRVPATQRALTGRDALWVLAAKRLLTLAITGVLVVLQVLVRQLGRLSGRDLGEALGEWAWDRLARRRKRGGPPVDLVVKTVGLDAMLQVKEPKRPRLTPLTPLDQTSLDPRTVKSLRRVGVRTLDKLITMYADYGRRGMLGQIRNFGRVDMDEVLRVLERDTFD